MIDIHSHILPSIDDGSHSVEQSLQMLNALAQQGVTTVAATPHFYATQNTPQQFLDHREEAVAKLQTQLTDSAPRVILGAEVFFFEGMSQTELLPQLKIQGTELLLVEMPFAPWSENWVRELLSIHQRDNFTVLLAHIERYTSFVSKRVLEQLLSRGVLFQANAEFFLHWKTRRRALNLLRKEKIHFLGTDCHNMTSRPPNLEPAQALIKKRLGEEAIARLEAFERRYIAEVPGT